MDRACVHCHQKVLKQLGISTNIGVFHEKCWDEHGFEHMKDEPVVEISLERVIYRPRTERK